MIDIKKRVKDLCKKEGISVSLLAEKLGMPQTTLDSIIKRGDPKISVVVDMAEVFGMTLSEFMQDERKGEPAYSFTLPDGTKIGMFPMVIE